MFALRDILPDRRLQCWKLFVKASRIFCSTIIPISQVKLADELFVKCFQAVENLYVLSGIHRVCISVVIYVNVILILAVCIASGASRLSITMEF